MAKFCISFVAPGRKPCGWQGEITREQVLQLRDIAKVFPDIADPLKHTQRLVSGFVQHGPAAMQLLHTPGQELATANLIAWYGIWSEDAPGDERVRERAGIADLKIEFTHTGETDDKHTFRFEVILEQRPVSHLLPGETITNQSIPGVAGGDHVTFMAFATTLGDKTVFTGVGIGRYDETADHGPDSTERGLMMTEVAQGAFRAVQAHYTGVIKVIECLKADGVEERAVNELKNAKDGDGLFFLCANDEIVDTLHITQLFGLQAEPKDEDLAKRKALSEAPKAPKFALLAEKALRALADPRHLGVAAEVVNALKKWKLIKQWDPTTKRRLYGTGCAALTTRLREAHKLVFNDEFSRLVIQAAQQDPERIEQLLTTARPPFEALWVEWDRSTSPDKRLWQKDHDHWGFLLTPTTLADTFNIVIVIGDHTGDPKHGVSIAPGGLQVNFRQPVDSSNTNHPSIILNKDGIDDEQMIMGEDYWDRWHHSRADLMRSLSQHVIYCMEAPPYGTTVMKIIRHEIKEYGDDFKHAPISKYLTGYALMMPSIFRELVAGLALVATHVGGSPLVKETATKTGKAYYYGKFHPAVEYKILQLARPMTAPHLWRRVFRRKPSQPARWHQVMGHWAHQRAANALCPRHPINCLLATWQPIEGRAEPLIDGLPERKPGDIQECARCKRHRWWVRDHARGDVREGMVEKGYEITANKRRGRPAESPPEPA